MGEIMTLSRGMQTRSIDQQMARRGPFTGYRYSATQGSDPPQQRPNYCYSALPQARQAVLVKSSPACSHGVLHRYHRRVGRVSLIMPAKLQ